MPTARPSISARVGAVLDTVTTDDVTITAVIVTPTPTRAVRIGIPAASREPKVSTRIMKETRRPSSSGTLFGSEVLLYASPPTEDVTAEEAGGVAARWTSWRVLS